MHDTDWLVIDEYCDYCAHRWTVIIPAEQADLGPICPQCGIENDPRELDPVETPQPITPTA
jgi:hypothetical protein